MLTIITCIGISILCVVFLGFIFTRGSLAKYSKTILLKSIIVGFVFGLCALFLFGLSTYGRHQSFVRHNEMVTLRIKGERLCWEDIGSTIKEICKKGINVSISPIQIDLDKINELSEKLADAYSLSYAIMQYERCEDKLVDLDKEGDQLLLEIKRIENSPWTIWVLKN